MKKLIKNSLFGSAGFFIISIVALITTPYYVSKLTIEVYGIYILITSLIGYYNLIDLGLGQGVIKLVSENVATGEVNKASSYINLALLAQLFLGGILTYLLFICANELISFLKIPPAWNAPAILGIKLCSIGFLFSVLSSTLVAALHGLQRFDVTSVIDASLNILLNVMIVCILFFGYGMLEVIYATTFISILTLSIYIFVLRTVFPAWHVKLNMNKSELTKLFSFSSYLFYSKVSNIFANYIVRYIIAAFAGPAAVAIFIVPTKLVNAVCGVLSSGVNAIFPYASEIHAREPKRMKQLFSKSTRAFSIISVPIMIFIILYSEQIMTIWIGNTFVSESYIILSLLALSSMIASQSTIPNLIITSMGYSKTLGIFGIISLLCYSIFIPFFTYNYNILGTAIGMLLSAIISTFIVFVFTTRLAGIRLLSFVKSTYIYHYLPVTIITIISISLSNVNNINTFLSISIGILMLAVYYVYILINDKVIMNIIEVRWKEIKQEIS